MRRHLRLNSVVCSRTHAGTRLSEESACVAADDTGGVITLTTYIQRVGDLARPCLATSASASGHGPDYVSVVIYHLCRVEIREKRTGETTGGSDDVIVHHPSQSILSARRGGGGKSIDG